MFSSAASNSSRGSGSEDNATGPSRLKNVGGPEGDDERNDFEETHKIQAGIFSVLYILSKEKMNENLKFTIIKLCFDFTQLFALVVNPDHGWKVDSTSVYWQIVTFSRWNYIVTKFLGYKAYVAILYTMTGMLFTALALCVWIAYSYKNRSFAYTWPIHVLRIYATIHFGLFDIATLTLIQVSYDCQFLGSGATMRGRMYAYPDKVCYKTPHLIPFIVGLVTQVVFVMAAVIFFTGEFEVNPISRRFTCCAHSHVEVRAFLLKVAMTVVYVLVGWLQVQTSIQAFLCMALTWIFFKNMPYMFAIINHIRVGSYLAVTWAAILALAIMFKPHGKGPDAVSRYEQLITNFMLYGLAPVALLGFGASYFRLNTWSRFVRRRFKEAPAGSKVKDIYRFSDPVEVEIIARVARHWIDDEVLDLDRVKEAEAIIKAGLVLFPTRAFMVMLYSNFLWDVLDNPQAGYSQLQAAKKANPNYMERFAIYRREQEHLARTAQTKGNGESTLDLVSYVEFQRNFRLAMRAHREALLATRNFWQYLLQQHITFTHLSKSLNAIESSIVKADKVYRTVLERYPYSTKIIKSYAHFLEGVKNDPWRASKFYSEAEKLDAEREEEAAALELEGLDGDNDSRLLNKVDERVNAVVIINSRGQIQMANKLAYAMFGYNKGELEGKNVAMLMPMPFSQRHNGYIKRHITTGRETVMNRVTDLVALHKDRYVFNLSLAVSKVSGAGDDSLFMGVTVPVEPDFEVANVYILPGGAVAAVDQAFVDWFGYTVEDYLGHPVHTLAVDPTPFKRLVDEVTRHDQPNEDGLCPVFIRQKQAFIKHKYTDPVDVSLRLKASGCGSETIYCVEMRRNQDPVELILTNRKGRICFISSPLAKALGHTPRTLRKVDIGELLPQPFGALHAAWVREAADTKPPPLSCRSNLTTVLGPTPKTQQAVHLYIKSTDESGEQQHVVKVVPSTIPKGLDERRLRLTVDASGTVIEVGNSPSTLFGFKPSVLTGRNLADCVDVLHAATRSAAVAAANGGPPTGEAANSAAAVETRKVLNLMLARSLERPGTSWRVGVMPPLDNVRSLGSIATALLAKQTRAAVMELDVKVDLEDLAASRNVTINISLWRAELMCGVVEVDKEGTILTAQDHPFYPSGLMFGVSNTSMLRQSLGRFLQLGSRSIESLFSSDTHRKKGALKSSSTPTKKVGPLRQMNGYHSDGEVLPLSVQLVRKEGTNSRSYVVLHFKEPTRGSRDFLLHLQRGPVEPQPDANAPDNHQTLSPRVGMPLIRAHTATASTLGAGVSGADETRVLRKLKSNNDQGVRQSPQAMVQAKPPPLTPLTGVPALDNHLSPVESAAPPPALPPPPPPPQQEQQPAAAAPAQGSAVQDQQQQQQAPPEGSADGASKDDTSASAKEGALPAADAPQEPADQQAAAAAAAAAGAPADAARAPAALPPPPPPLSLLAGTALSQPRVATPNGNAPGRRQSSALAGAEAGPLPSPVNPSQVLGLTLADYLVGAVERSAESEDDLAALFQQAVGEVKEAEEAAAAAAAAAAAGAGGETQEAAEGERALAQQQGQRIASGRSSGRAIAPRQAPAAMRPLGLSNLSFNRKLAEQQAAEQQAAAEGAAAPGPAAGDTDEQQLPADSSVQLPPPPQVQAPSTDSPADAGTGAPEAPAHPAPAAAQPPTQQPSQQLTKVNSNSSVSRVKAGPMGPPSPVQKTPPHAAVSQPNTATGMGPMRSQPPSSHQLMLAAQLKADLAAGRGGGSSGSLMGLAAAGRSGSQEPKSPLVRINSHESEFGVAQRRNSIKTVSFAPSQLMIDEAGHIERHPSAMQLEALGGTQPRAQHQQQNGGAAQRSQASLFGDLLGLGGDGEGDGDREGQGEQLGAGAAGGVGHAHKVKSNVKLARITEWVMSDGERYFRLEDVQDVGDTVYPFGPDLLMREDSRVSQPLLLDGGGDPDEEDDVDAAPSRWADADGAELRDLDDGSSGDMEGGAGGDKGGRSVLLDSAPRGVNVERHRESRNGKGGGGGGGDDTSGGGGDDSASQVDDDDNKSTMSASNGGAGGGTSVTADFRRGKRFRKLLKMLSTPAVQRATSTFRWQALIAIAVQLLANLGCFVGLTVLILQQTRGMSELDDAGKALVSCHDALVTLQVMDNIYANRSAAGVGLYDRESIGRLEGQLKEALDISWQSHNNIYLGAHALRALPSAYNLSYLWNEYNHQELLFYGSTATDQRSTTLWRLGNAFLRQGYELHHRHGALVEQLGELSLSDQFRYINSNGLFELFHGYSNTLNSLVYQAVDKSNTINRLQLVLLVIEGCCICAIVVAYMAWLLKKVDNQRYCMYGVFLIVPVGLVRGLASRSVTVDEGNSDGEGEGGENEGGDDYAGGLPTLPGHGTHEKHGDGGGGGGHREHGGAASSGIRINLAGDGQPSQPRRSGGGGGSGGGASSSGLRSLYERVAFWKHGTVRHGKRTMLRNSKESLWLLAPFVVWGLVVVVMHSLGYVIMEQAGAPVAMTNVVNTVLVRIHRVVYFAQELAAASSPEAQAALYPVFGREVADLKLEWDVMLYGANSSQATDPHFSLAMRGVAFESGPTSDILFEAGRTCWMPVGTDCYLPDHPYYAVVRRGLNAMMQRFFVEADLMLRDTASAWTLNSTRVDYIYHEGTGNMHWAMYDLTNQHLNRVVGLYMRVEVFHVVVFVLSWLLALVFLFCMLRPFMGKTKRETERIAEMLSQLPADVDVEGLLNKALVSIRADHRSNRNRVAPAVTAGGDFDGGVSRPPFTKQA